MEESNNLLADSSLSVIFPVVLVIIGILILASLIIFSEKQLHWDCAALLQSSQMMLRGAMPYVDFGSTNPPLIYYINILPVIIAQLTGFDLPKTFWVLVFLLVLYSGAAFQYIALKTEVIKLRSGRLLVLATFIGFSLFVFAQGNFGQREHLFFLGYVPLILCRVARYQGHKLPTQFAVVVGLIGGLTALLKPHFFLMVILVEMWMIFRKRRLSELITPEIIVQFSLASLFAVHFFLIPAPMRNAIFFRWIPFVMSSYDAYNSPLLHIKFLSSPANVALIVVLILLFFFLARRKYKKYLFLFESLFLAALIGLGIYIIQHKGFDYHIIPYYGFLTILVALVVLFIFLDFCTFFDRNTKSLNAFHLIGVAIFSVAIGFGYIQLSRYALRFNLVSELNPFIDMIQEHTVKSDKVTFISSSLIPAYPTLIYAERITGTRYLHAFPIPMLYKNVHMNPDGSFPYRKLKDAPREEIQFLNELGGNVFEHKPKLIFIHSAKGCQACPEGFVIKDYLDQVGWTVQYLVSYRHLLDLSNFKVYIRSDIE